MTSEPSALPQAMQARSRLTQDRIFDAGLRLLEQGGPDALTVAAVAADAGVAVGSVYRRFGDKERLLGAIQARFVEEFTAELRQRVADTGLTPGAAPAEVIGAAVRGVGETFRSQSVMLRVFALLGTHNDAVLEVGARASTAGGRYFRDTVLLAAPAFRHHADVEVAVDVAYRLTYAGFGHRVIHGEFLESDRPLSWHRLIEELTAAVTAYLIAPLPEREQGLA